MDMLESRRGVSPLVATFMLIGFSVLLGGVVMSWGQKYIEQHAAFASGGSELGSSCNDVDLRISLLSTVKQACVRGEALEVTFENGFAMEIADVHASIIGMTGTSTVERTLTSPIAKGGTSRAVISLKGAGQIQKVKLTPKVKQGRETVPCVKKAIILENVQQCA